MLEILSKIMQWKKGRGPASPKGPSGAFRRRASVESEGDEDGASDAKARAVMQERIDLLAAELLSQASAWKDAELGWLAEIETLKQRNAELEGLGAASAGPRNSDGKSWSGHEAGEMGNDIEVGDDQRGGDGTRAELTKRISSMLGAQIEREFERLDPAIARQQRLWEERERDRRAQETSVTVPDAPEQLPVSKQLQFSVC